MKAIHLDPVGGIAGDMFVAAMLDAFPSLRERVLADAASVLPPQAGEAYVAEGNSGALRALRFGLLADGRSRSEGSAAPIHHDGHVHHDHDGDCGHHHHHRCGGSFRDLVGLIEAAPLHEGTASQAVAILTIIAGAEAAIHQVPVEDVHFHEIADWDSLLDVVAAGSILAALGEVTWALSPLPRGGGLVKTQHGLLPVPAPATATILNGFNWRDDGIAGERVTPTGAAILRHIVPKEMACGAGRLVATGTGAGTRHLPGMANVLRALVFEAEEPETGGVETVTVISFEVDDMTGEEIGVASDLLRSEPGVLDLTLQQRRGKKGRPAESFQLVVRPESTPAVIAACFAQTATIGLRLHEERRVVLARKHHQVDGIGVKTVCRPGGPTAKAESDHLRGATLEARRQAGREAETGHVDG